MKVADIPLRLAPGLGEPAFMCRACNMHRDLETLLEASFIRIRYAPGDGDTLAVSFASIGNGRRKVPPDEFVGTILGDRSRHGVFISDVRRSWMNDTEVRAAITHTLPELFQRVGIRRVTTLGLSVGAYSALLAHQLFPVDAVLAFSPQYSVDRKFAPEETRWRYWTKQIPAFEFPTVEPMQTRGRVFILHGLEDDLQQMRRFPVQKNLDHFVFSKLAHSTVPRAIKDAGQLAPLLDAVESGNRKAVSRIIQRLGGTWRARHEKVMVEGGGGA